MSSPLNDKFISINGKLTRNPDYKPPTGERKPIAIPVALAFPSTPADIVETAELYEANGKELELTDATAIAIEAAADDCIVSKFKCASLDGSENFAKLTEQFARYEVPLGLLNKLLGLSEWDLNFIVDDSGSMSMDTDSMRSDFGPYMMAHYMKKTGRMTRWEEVQDRLHCLIDILSYIPVPKVTITFMNRANVILLVHSGETPDVYKEGAHKQIISVFASGPSGGTPTDSALKKSLDSSPRALHYVFTDGAPNNGGASVEKVVASRKDPSLAPITFISCTDDDAATEWMKGIDEKYPFVAEVDDYADERDEILKKQGGSVPFTVGIWIVCMLIAAINPNDLDCLDESRPLTKYTLDNILGRTLMEPEYELYFAQCPSAKSFKSKYKDYLTVQRAVI